jgi:hypothetical protein
MFALAQKQNGRLLEERALDCQEAPKGRAKRGRPARSVTVNVAESPLGWLHSRGLVTVRQFDAGERLRADWERAQLAPRITMAWDAAPISGHRGGSSATPDLSGSQIDAKRRFHAAMEHAGGGSATFSCASSAPAKACARRRPRLAGRRERAG